MSLGMSVSLSRPVSSSVTWELGQRTAEVCLVQIVYNFLRQHHLGELPVMTETFCNCAVPNRCHQPRATLEQF